MHGTYPGTTRNAYAQYFIIILQYIVSVPFTLESDTYINKMLQRQAFRFREFYTQTVCRSKMCSIDLYRMHHIIIIIPF